MAASPRGLTMSNDEQIWLMQQVKNNVMTIDEAVTWKETRINDLKKSTPSDVIKSDDVIRRNSDYGVINETDGPRKTMANYNFINPTNILKNFLNKKNTRENLTKSPRSLSNSEENLTSKSFSDLDLRNKKTYNFLIYKFNKLKQPQKRILQIDFDAKFIYFIHRGNITKSYQFSSLSGANGQDGKRVFINFDDSSQDVEILAENLDDKTKLLRLLNVINEQNNCEGRGESFDPCEKLNFSFRVIKEGILEKKKEIISAINWNRRQVVIRSGELAYYRTDDEEQPAALNIIHLSPGSVAIHTEDNNTFTVATTKESYRFRIPDSGSFTSGSLHQIRDDWIAAIQEGCRRDYKEEEVNGKNEEEKRRSEEIDDVFVTSPTDAFALLYKDLHQLKTNLGVTNNNNSSFVDEKIASIYKALQEIQIGTNGVKNKADDLYATADDFKSLVKSDNGNHHLSVDDNSNEEPRLRRSTGVIYSKVSPKRNKGRTRLSVPSTNQDPVPEDTYDKIGPDTQLLDVIGPKQPAIDYSVAISDANGDAESIVIQYVPKPPENKDEAIEVTYESLDDVKAKSEESSPTKSVASIQSLLMQEVISLQSPESKPSLPSPPPGVAKSNEVPTSPTTPISPSFIPPPPVLSLPPPSLNGIPPPPPLSQLPSRADTKSLSTAPMRPIHWTIVPKHLIAKSMWKNAENFKINIDQKELVEMFQVTKESKFSNSENPTPTRVMVLPTADNTPKKKKAGESYLDRRTAQNLGIFMAGFKLRGDELVKHLSILKEEDGGITTEQVSALIKFCPEPEMKSMYSKHSDGMGDLAKEDKFMSELCQIPRLNLRLEMIVITREIPQELEAIQPNVDLALQSCKELLNSKMFESVLACILAFANAINSGNTKGTTKGIRLSTLETICKMKTNNRKLTLLHVVVKHLRTNSPQLLQFSDEMKSLEKPQPYSTKGLVAELDVMRKSVLKVKKHCEVIKRKKNQPTSDDLAFCNNVELEVCANEKTIQQMTDKCAEIRKTVVKLIAKFGESPDTSSQVLFEWVRNFLVEFKSCASLQK